MAAIFGSIFIVSVFLAFRSMREFKSPANFYPKFDKRVRGLLSGIIELPKR